jgi:predicted DNA-binding transcriptional regulator AlpA
MPRGDALPLSLAPRGLGRVVAAQYLGISPTTFDRLVLERKMPAPKLIAGRRVWDRVAIDAAFEALGEPSKNEWDDAA